MDPTTQITSCFAWLDQLKFNRFHRRMLVLIGLIFLFAGYNSQIIAYIVPLVLKEWHLTALKAGTMISYGFAGLMIGAAGFGTASDHLGRKKAIMLAVAVFSVFNSAAYFAPNFEVFCLLRLLAGIGVGGSVPLLITLFSEFAPSASRARLIATSASIFTIGWALAGLAAMLLIPRFGWRIVLLIGFLPVFFIPVIQAYLPESVRFLAGKRRYHDAIREIEKIEKTAGLEPYRWGPEHFMQPAAAKESGVKFVELFRHGLNIMTILIWGTYLFCMIALYGLSTWLPSLLADTGFSLVRSYSYGIAQSLGATIGGSLLGFLMDALGRKLGLCISFFLGGVSVLLFGVVTSEASLYVVGTATGVFLIGIPAAMHVVASETYPTYIRSTGTGWAYAIGRIGSIIGPIMGGMIQMAGFSFFQFFVIFSLPCFVCVMLVALYPLGVKNESLETVSKKLLK